MLTVTAHLMGNNVLVSKSDLDKLVELAQNTEHIELQTLWAEDSLLEMMELSEQGGSFNFWKRKGEDIYSVEDGEPV